MCILNIATACIMSAQLTALDVGYSNTLDKTAYSYDGEARDISRFYNDKQTNFEIGGYVNIDSDKEVEVYYNNGIQTQKYTKKPTISIAYSQSYDKITLTGSVTKHGESIHTPCYDNFDRQYYCGNLTAWSNNGDINEESNYNFTLNINYRF